MNIRNIKLVTLDATNMLLSFSIPPWEDEHGFEGTRDELRQVMLENTLAIAAKYPQISRFSVCWVSWFRHLVQTSLERDVPDHTNPDNMINHLIEFQLKRYWACAEGAERLLRSLKAKQIEVGVVTNSDPCLDYILQGLHLNRNIDFVIKSHEERYNIPDDNVFLDAVGNCRVRVKPSECLHIAFDEQIDYAGAKAAGWHSVLVSDNTNPDLPLPATRHIFKTLNKLAHSIENNHLYLA